MNINDLSQAELDDLDVEDFYVIKTNMLKGLFI